MKNRAILVALSIIFVISTVASAANNIRSATYKQTLTGMGMREMTMQVWMKDNMMRIDSTPGGQLVTTIRRPDGLYNYVPSQNMLTKMPEMDSKEEIRNPREFVEYLYGMGISPAGAEKVGQYDCNVYKYKDTFSGSPTTAWIWKEKNFPVKIEIETPFGTSTAVFSDININVEISDRMFDLPKNARFFDISDPWKGLKAPPESKKK
jgi:outer membrane lipoprotein-sorting protein